MKYIAVVSLILLSLPVLGQKKISATIIDSESREPIPYASIGISGRSSGTSANDLGQFEIFISDLSDTLIISCIGYDNKFIPLSDSSFQLIFLKPRSVLLKEVVVTDNMPEGGEIVRRAYKAIRDNYIDESFTMNTFYRHYCKDDTTYGRLIEAAAQVYKPKGYRKPERPDKSKDIIHINQLRRSFDMSYIAATHIPIGLDLILHYDIAGFQEKKKRAFFNLIMQEGSLNFLKNIEDYDFMVTDLTTFNNKDVWVVDFEFNERKSLNLSNFNSQFYFNHFGKLFIEDSTYAFIKMESFHDARMRKSKDVVFYKKFGDKYGLFHVIHESTIINKDSVSHVAHIELLVNDIIKGKNKDIKETPRSQEGLAGVPYDPEFWNSYNIVKANPLEEKIAEDLSKNIPLEEQYARNFEKEKELMLHLRKSRLEFNEITSDSTNDVVYVDFWASWCGPCLYEMQSTTDIVEEYQQKGVKFLYASIDFNREKWKAMDDDLGLGRYKSIWLGGNSEIQEQYAVETIPRYLIFKNGELINDDAPRPSQPEFRKIMDQLLLPQEMVDNPN